MKLREWVMRHRHRLSEILSAAFVASVQSQKTIEFKRALSILILTGFSEEEARRILTRGICAVYVDMDADLPDLCPPRQGRESPSTQSVDGHEPKPQETPEPPPPEPKRPRGRKRTRWPRRISTLPDQQEEQTQNEDPS